MEGVTAALLIGCPLAGALIGNRYALALPLGGWPLFYLGLHEGWWGSGLGDFWQYPAAALTTIGVVTTALAVAAARRVGLDPSRRSLRS